MASVAAVAHVLHLELNGSKRLQKKNQKKIYRSYQVEHQMIVTGTIGIEMTVTEMIVIEITEMTMLTETKMIMTETTASDRDDRD